VQPEVSEIVSRRPGPKTVLAAATVAAIVCFSASAEAEVVAPHAVKPQVVTPQVVTPPAPSQAPSPSPSAPPPQAPSPSPSPAPAPAPSPAPAPAPTAAPDSGHPVLRSEKSLAHPSPGRVSGPQAPPRLSLSREKELEERTLVAEIKWAKDLATWVQQADLDLFADTLHELLEDLGWADPPAAGSGAGTPPAPAPPGWMVDEPAVDAAVEAIDSLFGSPWGKPDEELDPYKEN
jgi:hypothetical protein